MEGRQTPGATRGVCIIRDDEDLGGGMNRARCTPYVMYYPAFGKGLVTGILGRDRSSWVARPQAVLLQLLRLGRAALLPSARRIHGIARAQRKAAQL
jgi:hypothetical protein